MAQNNESVKAIDAACEVGATFRIIVNVIPQIIGEWSSIVKAFSSIVLIVVIESD